MAVADRAPLSQFPVRRESGAVGAGASVHVYLPGTTTDVTVYTTRTGGTTTSQPLTADSRGLLSGWVALNDDGLDVVVTIDGATGSAQRIRPGSTLPSASVTSTELGADSVGDSELINNSITRAHFATTLLQHSRTSTGSIAASAGATVTVNWPVNFPNTNYTCLAEIEDSTPTAGATRVLRILSKAVGSISVRVVNDDSGSSHTGTIHAVGYLD